MAILDEGVDGRDIGTCFLSGGGAVGESKTRVGCDSKDCGLGVGGMGIGTGGGVGAGVVTFVSILRGGVLDFRGLNFGAVCIENADGGLVAAPASASDALDAGNVAPLVVGAVAGTPVGGVAVVAVGCDGLPKNDGANDGAAGFSFEGVVLKNEGILAASDLG